jgi:hypothetical protein
MTAKTAVGSVASARVVYFVGNGSSWAPNRRLYPEIMGQRL